jgi:hypothetical protein
MNNKNKDDYDFSYHQASGVIQVPIASDDFRALKIHSDTAKTFDFSIGPGLGELEEVIIESSKELKTLMWPKSASTVTCLKLSYLNRLSQLDLSAFPNLEVLSIMGCPALSKISGISSSLRVFNAYDVNLEQIDLSAAKRLEVFNVRTNAARFNINLSRYTGLSSFSLVMNQLSNKKNKVMIDLSAASKLRSCLIETQHATAKVNLTGCDHLLYKHFVCSDDSTIQQTETVQEVKLDPDALRELSSLFQRDIRVIASHYDGILTVIKQLGKNPSGGEITLADIALVSVSLTNRAYRYRPGEVAAQYMMQALASLEQGSAESSRFIISELPHKENLPAHLAHAGLWDHPHPDHPGESQEGDADPIESVDESQGSDELLPEHPISAEAIEPAEVEGVPEDEGFDEHAFERAFNEAYDVLLKEGEWIPAEEAWLEACRPAVYEVYEAFQVLRYAEGAHQKSVSPVVIPVHPASPASHIAVPYLKQVMQRLLMLRSVTPPISGSTPTRPQPEQPQPHQQPQPDPLPTPPFIIEIERPLETPLKPPPMDNTLQEIEDDVISQKVTHHAVQLPVIKEAVVEELTRLIPIPASQLQSLLVPVQMLSLQYQPLSTPNSDELPSSGREHKYRWGVVQYVEDFFKDWKYKTHPEEKERFDQHEQLSAERMKDLGTARDQRQETSIEHFRYFTPRFFFLGNILLRHLKSNTQLDATQDITAEPLTNSLKAATAVLKDLMGSQAFIEFLKQGVTEAKAYSLGEDGQFASAETVSQYCRKVLEEEGEVIPFSGDPVSHYYRYLLGRDESFQAKCDELENDKDFKRLLTHPALINNEEGQFFLKLLAVLLTTAHPPRAAVFVRPERFDRKKLQFKSQLKGDGS